MTDEQKLKLLTDALQKRLTSLYEAGDAHNVVVAKMPTYKEVDEPSIGLRDEINWLRGLLDKVEATQ